MKQKTVIIELDGHIAAGKSTLAEFLKSNTNIRPCEGSLKRINKATKFRIIMRFILKYPRFTFHVVRLILKTGSSYPNTLKLRLEKMRLRKKKIRKVFVK